MIRKTFQTLFTRMDDAEPIELISVFAICLPLFILTLWMFINNVQSSGVTRGVSITSTQEVTDRFGNKSQPPIYEGLLVPGAGVIVFGIACTLLIMYWAGGIGDKDGDDVSDL